MPNDVKPGIADKQPDELPGIAWVVGEGLGPHCEPGSEQARLRRKARGAPFYAMGAPHTCVGSL